MATGKASTRPFGKIGVNPSDFDFAEIYDCFSFIVLRQIEEMGFVQGARRLHSLRKSALVRAADCP